MDLGNWTLPIMDGDTYYLFIVPYLALLGFFGWERPI